MTAELELKASLEKALDNWVDKHCEDWNVGYFYEGQLRDMTEAAWLVLKASRDGQEFAAEQ